MDIGPLAIGIISFGVLVVLIILGIQVGLSLGFVGFIGLVLVTGSFTKALPILLTTPYSTVVNFGFIVMPLFVLMGSFATYGGFAENLYAAASKWLGRVPGGLGIATAWACLMFGAASGSNVAAAAVFTKISLPQMLKRNYDRKFSVGTIVTSAMLTVIMPPSLLLVIYGIITEQPIGRLLMAGIFPSIILAIGISAYLWIMVKIKPSLAPKEATRASWRERIISLKGTWMIVALAIIVLGGIYSGVFSPTEAAAAGASAAFIFLIIGRKLNRGILRTALMETLEFTVMIFLILIGAFIFSRFLAMSGFTAALLNTLLSVNMPGIVLIIVLMIMYLILGLFLPAIAMMSITLPIVFPAIIGLGYDGVWFGIILLLAMTIGAMTPPFGLEVFAVKSASKIDMSIEDMFRGCFPFLSVAAVVWAILIAFPQISLFLPNLMLSR